MTMFFSNTSVKQFLGLHLFEVGYLGVLAVLPFLVAIPAIGLTILAVLAFLSFSSIWRMLTFRWVSNPDRRSVFITGCDTGFGHALAKRMSSLGMTVYAGCLNPEGEGAKLLKTATSSENIHVIPLDVTSEESVMSAVDVVKKKTKDEGVWALVNNAGVSCLVDVEFCSMDTYRKVTEVNLLGTVLVTKAFLPHIRKCQGRVINVTSAAVCYPYHSAHAMTKAGCDAFSNSLRREMRKFGVRVITVEPGNFYGATGLLNKSIMSSLEKEHQQVWEKAHPEVKTTYGKNYFAAVQQSISKFSATSCNSLGPVVDKLEEAILSTRPGSCYLVDGSSLLFDIHNMLLRLRWLVPQHCLDIFMEWEFPSGLSSSAKKSR
ncbi:D-beta-hydroxybutyrate dehydrogenase, mitochondrial-like [Ylistrum balloti]|uniref:D-beta-hydroxybutyrate dehydrogenase, mitochondrial-like n=1 Tax=Ylistrum balloti TaxID=509963 RepID=UPI0029058B52|nr:D-beta-hydroxybutyrate dehydrogenase, mitochondrial-like [Ylistrum balloti]